MDLNRLVYTLLVFGIYLKINELNALFASIIQRSIAIKKAINEIQKYTVL